MLQRIPSGIIDNKIDILLRGTHRLLAIHKPLDFPPTGYEPQISPHFRSAATSLFLFHFAAVTRPNYYCLAKLVFLAKFIFHCRKVRVLEMRGALEVRRIV